MTNNKMHLSSMTTTLFQKERECRLSKAEIESRAQGANLFGGVCINLLRHPAWGRAQETYGEDPYHVGEMGKALTESVQEHNVIACIKHYAVNNIENSRFTVKETVGFSKRGPIFFIPVPVQTMIRCSPWKSNCPDHLSQPPLIRPWSSSPAHLPTTSLLFYLVGGGETEYNDQPFLSKTLFTQENSLPG